MSHEIRTPLNAVIGFSDILEDTSLSHIQKDYVDTIRESGKLLLALINDILDFSKIEAGQIDLEAIDFNLKNLVEDVLKIARPKVSGVNIELYHHYDEETPVYFKGDPTRVRQIILNLLNNAIKFTEKGEIGVHVRPGETEAAADSAGDGFYTVNISVKDTGIGIPEDKQKAIFGTFTQADSSMTRRYGGTGLGLAITSALVKKMEGKIWVNSKVGEGSEFLFTLRLKESDASAFAEISPIQTEELQGKSVLVVDDNENARRLMKSFCQKAGLDILAIVPSAIDGLQELEKMEKAPDLIISDIMMPEMDGLEFARKIRASQKYKETKLVAVSSDARPGSAKAAKESGYDAFITKPVSERSVINIMKTVLGDKRMAGQIVTTHMAEELITKKIRVLVVDDNPVNQKLLRVLLGKLGCEEEVVSNGKEAVEKAMAEEFDLCLMDLHMPVMNGIEATKEIRRRGKTELPIIALTAAAFKEGKDKCFEAGMNDFLTQPVEPKKLEKKIIEWTKKEE
jgi:CheY-like chemotaxis protein